MRRVWSVPDNVLWIITDDQMRPCRDHALADMTSETRPSSFGDATRADRLRHIGGWDSPDHRDPDTPTRRAFPLGRSAEGDRFPLDEPRELPRIVIVLAPVVDDCEARLVAGDLKRLAERRA